MNLPFISDDGVKDQTFIEVAGKYAEGVYATGPMDTSSNPLAVKAVADHKAKFGDEPGAFFLNAYAATVAVVNAIQKAGSTDYDAVTKALRSEYVETPLGKISFDAARRRDRLRLLGVPGSERQVRRTEVKSPTRDTVHWPFRY